MTTYTNIEKAELYMAGNALVSSACRYHTALKVPNSRILSTIANLVEVGMDSLIPLTYNEAMASEAYSPVDDYNYYSCPRGCAETQAVLLKEPEECYVCSVMLE